MALTQHMVEAVKFCGIEYPETDWLVERTLPHPSLGELYAKRGTGKTWAALSLAVEATVGGVWLIGPLKARRKRVLYVDGEMPPALLQERLKGLLGGRSPEGLWMMCLAGASPKPNFASLATWQQMGASCKEQGIDFVVMDNWACLVRGVDENDNKRVAEVMDGPIELRAQGVSVLWVHHAGKAGTQRGASAREDALDYVFALEGEGKPHGAAKFRVELEKSRQMVKWDEPSVELREMPDGALKWCAAEEKMGSVPKKVLEHLRKAGAMGERHLRADLKINGVQMRKAIDWLSDNGMIVRGEYGWAAI